MKFLHFSVLLAALAFGSRADATGWQICTYQARVLRHQAGQIQAVLHTGNCPPNGSVLSFAPPKLRITKACCRAKNGRKKAARSAWFTAIWTASAKTTATTEPAVSNIFPFCRNPKRKPERRIQSCRLKNPFSDGMIFANRLIRFPFCCG